MTKTLPIKDVNIIKNIKELYIKKNNIRDLLLFLLSINTGMSLHDLLNLNIKDVKDKYYLILKNKCSVPLNNEIRNLIKIVINKRGINEPLFINAKKNRLDRTLAFRNFKEVRKELALADSISISSFRKIFGYFYYLKYKDLGFLQWLFNQSSVEQLFEFIDVKENMNLRFRDGICL